MSRNRFIAAPFKATAFVIIFAPTSSGMMACRAGIIIAITMPCRNDATIR